MVQNPAIRYWVLWGRQEVLQNALASSGLSVSLTRATCYDVTITSIPVCVKIYDAEPDDSRRGRNGIKNGFAGHTGHFLNSRRDTQPSCLRWVVMSARGMNQPGRSKTALTSLAFTSAALRPA